MHCSLLMSNVSMAIFLWGEFFFATYFRQIMYFCAKNNFSSHLATMAIGSANPEKNSKSVTLTLRPCTEMGMVLLKILDKALSSRHK